MNVFDAKSFVLLCSKHNSSTSRWSIDNNSPCSCSFFSITIWYWLRSRSISYLAQWILVFRFAMPMLKTRFKLGKVRYRWVCSSEFNAIKQFHNTLSAVVSCLKFNSSRKNEAGSFAIKYSFFRLSTYQWIKVLLLRKDRMDPNLILGQRSD